MKKDIILAGVGGQGILSIAAVIGEAALKEGFNIKQAEVHGMSQRGGDVQSNLRISSNPIASDPVSYTHLDVYKRQMGRFWYRLTCSGQKSSRR